MADHKRVERIKDAINSYPDFPKKGILFRDMFSVLLQPQVFRDLIEELQDHIKNNYSNVEAIIGIESRGFLIAPILSLHFNVPFIPVRKAGKLPGQIKHVEYALEYGVDKLEIQSQTFKSGMKCLIFDDLLATGGSMNAASKLVKQCGGEVIGCLVIMELEELNGRKQLDVPLYSMVKY